MAVLLLLLLIVLLHVSRFVAKFSGRRTWDKPQLKKQQQRNKKNNNELLRRRILIPS